MPNFSGAKILVLQVYHTSFAGGAESTLMRRSCPLVFRLFSHLSVVDMQRPGRRVVRSWPEMPREVSPGQSWLGSHYTWCSVF
jgi:hypothetical protein